MWVNIWLKLKSLREEVLFVLAVMTDKNTPSAHRLVMIFVLLYVLGPIDIIPDYIPFVGIIDDLLIAPTVISLVTRFLPKAQVDRSRQRAASWQRKFPYVLLGVSLLLVLWLSLLIWGVYKLFN